MKRKVRSGSDGSCVLDEGRETRRRIWRGKRAPSALLKASRTPKYSKVCRRAIVALIQVCRNGSVKCPELKKRSLEEKESEKAEKNWTEALERASV